jgi:hypothetical protein
MSILKKFAIFPIITIASCSSSGQHIVKYSQNNLTDYNNLVINSEKYYGTNIVTEGILIDYYLARLDSNLDCKIALSDIKNKIIIKNKNIDLSRLYGKRVIIEGVFEYRDSVVLGFPEDKPDDGHAIWYLEESVGSGLVGVFEKVKLVSVKKGRKCRKR